MKRALAALLVGVGLILALGSGGPWDLPRAVGLAGLLAGAAVAWRWPLWGPPWLVVGFLGVALGHAALEPRHDRDWIEAQARLPRVTVDGDTFTVADQRAFRWTGPDAAEARWVDATYRLDAIEGADLGLSRFSDLDAVAHSFVSVRFDDGRVLVVSVEVRKEQGEAFSPVKGLLRHYEKMIVLGDEEDLIGLRAVQLGERVELHPLQVGSGEVERFLRAVLDEVQAIEAQPVWYHTVLASCSTSLARHLFAMGALPLDARVALPGEVDALAHELGWLGPEPLEVLRERARVDAAARAWDGRGDFSEALRR